MSSEHDYDGSYKFFEAKEPAAPSPAPAPHCDDCDALVPTWFAPNEVWNAVMPERVGMLCANCFIRHAEHIGFQCTGWELRPENPVPTPAADWKRDWDQTPRVQLGNLRYYPETYLEETLREREAELVRLRQQLHESQEEAVKYAGLLVNERRENARLRSALEKLEWAIKQHDIAGNDLTEATLLRARQAARAALRVEER